MLIGVAEPAGIEIEYLHAGIVRAGERDELFAIDVRRCGSNAAVGTALGGVVVFESVRYAASAVGAFLVIVVLMAQTTWRCLNSLYRYYFAWPAG